MLHAAMVLRVEMDAKLALGQFALEQAADCLATTLPMDSATARGEGGRPDRLPAGE